MAAKKKTSEEAVDGGTIDFGGQPGVVEAVPIVVKEPCIDITDAIDPTGVLNRSRPRIIYRQMAKVMADVGFVGKNKQSSGYGDSYKFRGIDDTMMAMQPALIKHGVVGPFPELLVLECSSYQTSKGKTMQHAIVHVRYTFYAEDGSSVSGVTPGEGADVGDKSVNKAMAGALKYFLTQSQCIPTEEPKDSENDSPDLSERQGKRPAPRGEAKPQITANDQTAWADSTILQMDKMPEDALRKLKGELEAEYPKDKPDWAQRVLTKADSRLLEIEEIPF